MNYSCIIIEDQPDVAQFLAQYLIASGRYSIMGMAHDMDTGRSLLASVEPDLILLDVYFPNGNGLDLLSELRTQSIKSDIMLLTAAREVHILERAMQLGICDFLVKPILIPRLEQALSNFESRQQQLADVSELTQSVVDTVLKPTSANSGTNSGTKGTPRLPKGVDSLTLEKIRTVFRSDNQQSLTAQKVGDVVGVSRSTARRYLEFLLESGELCVDHTYGTIGRPERCYRLGKTDK